MVIVVQYFFVYVLQIFLQYRNIVLRLYFLTPNESSSYSILLSS